MKKLKLSIILNESNVLLKSVGCRTLNTLLMGLKPEFLSEYSVTANQRGLKSVHESFSAEGAKATPLVLTYPHFESIPSYKFLGILTSHKSKGRCGWFYEEVLTEVYGTLEEVPYKGIGRKPFPRQMPDPALKYAQVVKERESGKIVNVTTRIVLGDELEILEILAESERCNTISTAFVESRNGAFRKDNKRHTRKTKCHSKRIEPHDAHVIFLKSVYNLTKENEKFKILLNPDAKKFEIKYKRVSPAMKQGLVNKIYPLEDLLLMKPLMFTID